MTELTHCFKKHLHFLPLLPILIQLDVDVNSLTYDGDNTSGGTKSSSAKK